MILLLLLFLMIVPFLIGQPVRKVLDYRGRGVVDSYLCGVMTMFVVSGAMHVLMMFLNRPFSDYEKIYLLILLAVALVGILLVVLDIKKDQDELSRKERFLGFWRSFIQSRESQIFTVLTVIVLLLCVVRIFVGTHDVTGDFTMETIRTTLATDSIYQYNSLTGLVIEEGMPIRQQILTMPFFLAFLSDMFKVEAGMLLYKIFPCYTLFLAVLVYAKWAGVLFVKQRDRQILFLLIASMLLFLGDYAQAAPAALLLHQGFTGNAMCAAVVIPFAIYACMSKKWLLACVSVAAELFLIWTTYGLGYCVLVILLFALLEIGANVVKRRKGKGGQS